MKRILISIIAVLAVFLITGCGSSASTSDSPYGSSSSNNKTEYGMNQDIYIKNSSGEYRLKVTGIRETWDRNEFSDKQANRVIIISYEYENISLDEDLYISEYDFKVYDKAGTSLETYPVDYKYADSISQGRRTTAEAAYALNNDENYVELEYYDNMFNSRPDCLIKIQW
jgi:hypothetical protein